MKKRTVIGFALFLLLTTIISKQKIVISKFSLKEVEIENNFLIKKKDIQKLLAPIYGKNLVLLKNEEIKKILMQNTLIESFNLKKKYPDKLKIKIFEKAPIAILTNKKEKFYLTEKINLIKFENIYNFQDLPIVFGNKEEFKIFYSDLKKINFPLILIKKYILFDTKRWDIETVDKKIIKLPSKDYIKSLENYLSLKDKKNLKNYKVFDYRIDNQLILK
jgi:cell division septal protein FtsQ